MTDLIPFTFEDHAVRAFDRDGQPWFVLADVCRVLGINNPRDAAARLDDDEKDGVGIPDAMGREQNTTIINESGLYSLVLTSRKAAAKRFKKWVTAEVLPSIRKTGRYDISRAEPVPIVDMLDLERRYRATLERLVRFQTACRRMETTSQERDKETAIAFALLRNTDLSDEEIAARLPPSDLPRTGYIADCRRWLADHPE